MKIFVAGSTGRVGQALLPELTARGYEVIAAARRPHAVIKSDKIKPVKFDLNWTAEEMAVVLDETAADAVINVAGGQGNDLLQIDLWGFTKLAQAAEITGIKRYIQLSTVFALQPEKWTTPGFIALRDYYIARHFADRFLLDSTTKLDWTILQPGYLEEKPATGKIALADDISAPAIIPDVAATLAELIKFDNTIGKVLTMHNGDMPITKALESLKND